MKILFFRDDFHLDIAAAYSLATLASRPNTEVWQYCPFDLSGINLSPEDPLFFPNAKHNLIHSPKELSRRLKAGAFDLVILTPNTNWQTGRLAQWMLHLMEMPTGVGKRLQQYRRRFRKIPEKSFAHIPTIVIDMGDFSTVRPRETSLLLGDALYFKREVPYDLHRLFYGTIRQHRTIIEQIRKNLRQVPLGISNARYEELVSFRTTSKEFDVFWAGNVLNNTIRPQTIARLREAGERRGWKLCIPEKKIPFNEFSQLVARSKVTLSIAGNGWDCFRHYEATAAGSLPLMNRPTVDTPAWQDLPAALFFENHLTNLEERISDLLAASDAKRAELLDQCDKRVREKCLWSASMDYILAETRKRHPELPA